MPHHGAVFRPAQGADDAIDRDVLDTAIDQMPQMQLTSDLLERQQIPWLSAQGSKELPNQGGPTRGVESAHQGFLGRRS